MNEFNEKNVQTLTIEVPKGERPDVFLENFLGILPCTSEEMPSEMDTEATVFIELK